MTINIKSELMPAVKRHLSAIGKRLYNKDGKNMFSNITLSSAEDYEIVRQYSHAAAQTVEALCRQLVTAFTLSGEDIVIVITNTRGTTDYESRVKEIVLTYITLFVVGEYLGMTHPDLAEKYQTDAAGSMQSLVTYVFHKEAPTEAAASYNDINGTIE